MAWVEPRQYVFGRRCLFFAVGRSVQAANPAALERFAGGCGDHRGGTAGRSSGEPAISGVGLQEPAGEFLRAGLFAFFLLVDPRKSWGNGFVPLGGKNIFLKRYGSGLLCRPLPFVYLLS